MFVFYLIFSMNRSSNTRRSSFSFCTETTFSLLGSRLGRYHYEGLHPFLPREYSGLPSRRGPGHPSLISVSTNKSSEFQITKDTKFQGTLLTGERKKIKEGKPYSYSQNTYRVRKLNLRPWNKRSQYIGIYLFLKRGFTQHGSQSRYVLTVLDLLLLNPERAHYYKSIRKSQLRRYPTLNKIK